MSYLFHINYINTYLSAPDVKNLGKTAKVYARDAAHALEKLKGVVEKPVNSQRLVMEIQSIEEVL